MDVETMSSAVQPLLTDLYQITMCYAYWKSKKHEETAVFDLFFRKNPFQGEYTVFCGLADCLRFIEAFKFSETDVEYVRSVLPDSVEPEFFEYLRTVNCNDLRLYAINEGSVVFPKVPLIIVEGPLAICQLLETPMLNLVNFASLVCTNATRYRLAVGDKISLLEFGLRRAQGPNGALSASKYCYMGGFDGTSNCLAGKIYNIPVRGTQAHSFVTSYRSFDDLSIRHLAPADGSQNRDFAELCDSYLKSLCNSSLTGIVYSEVNKGELASFVAYAIAFPNGFLVLVDTYDVLRSGVVNFCAVALALHDLGYRALGVRIDSGDLAYLSGKTRNIFKCLAERYKYDWFEHFTIVASNDINEETLYSLKEQSHEVNSFGIGTHLVTCQKQPALGCVYKLVAVYDSPRIKLSQDVNKITIPGKKRGYRLIGKDKCSILDVLLLESEPAPEKNKNMLCRHPFQENKRAYVKPTEVMELHTLFWDNGRMVRPIPTLHESRNCVRESMLLLRSDHKRNLNPTPYKVAISEHLYEFMHALWLEHAPVGQLE